MRCTKRFPVGDRYERCNGEAVVVVMHRSGTSSSLDQYLCGPCRDDLLEHRQDLAEQVVILDLIEED